jgi:protein SCO1/2
MSTQMAKLQKAAGGAEDLRLVSLTVDPEIDTPERLAKYAQQFDAHADRWWFLRCSKEDVVRIAYDEARLVQSPDQIVLHSEKFALLDRDGAIRAYYSPLHDERWIEKLLADVETLRREPRR